VAIMPRSAVWSALAGRTEVFRTAMSVSNGGLGNAGGLSAVRGRPVVDSYATGNVSGTGFVGGLVGFNAYSPIIHSYAAGQVTSNDQGTYVGGLTGMNDGSAIDRSFSTGAVTCQFVCGGLVGINGAGGATSTISQSYATGSVSSSEGAGGLVGYNMFGAVSDSYAMDGVSAQTSGGLVGEKCEPGTFPAIARSYAAGAVTGTAGTTGGLIGYDEFASGIKHAYWDTTTSGYRQSQPGRRKRQQRSGHQGPDHRAIPVPACRRVSARKSGLKIPTSTAACPTSPPTRR